MRQLLLCICTLLSALMAWGQTYGPKDKGNAIDNLGIDARRLMRHRPLVPFDRDGVYDLLELMASRSLRDSIASSQHWALTGLIGTEVPIGTKWRLGFDGLVHLPWGSSPSEGQWLGYGIYAAYVPRPGHRLIIDTQHAVTTRTRAWLTENNLIYFYAPERSGLMVLSGGHTMRTRTLLQTNDEAFTAAFPSSLATANNITHYRRTYLSGRNAIDLTPQLRSYISALLEHRHPLLSTHSEHRALVAEVGLLYDFATRAPRQAYYPTSTQRPHGYFAPEVGISYRLACSPKGGTNAIPWSRYQQIEISLRSAYAWDDSHRLEWTLIAGKYLDRSRVTDTDERYLPMADAIGRSPFASSWLTPPSDMALGKHWIWGQATFRFGQALTSLLPSSARVFLDEAIHLRLAQGEHQTRWMEAGYSIGLGEMARIGIFAGTNFDGRHGVKVAFSIPLLYLTSSYTTRY